MKITEIKATALRIPQKQGYRMSVDAISDSADHVLIEVFTDEGIVGYGEAWRLTPLAVSTFIEECLKPLLLGEDPLRIEYLWEKMYLNTFRFGRKGMALHCISGVEIALWDILGKYRDIPVFEMLGGACRHKIRAYASLPEYQSPENAASEALRFVRKGYKSLKLHQQDTKYVEAVRKAVGDDVTLMVDVNGAWNPREAVDKIGEIQAYKIHWVEEPISPMDDYEGLFFVRQRSNVRIAAGENEYTHYGYKDMISRGAVDILQPDVIKSGGLMVCRKILGMAQAWNLELIPHSYYFGPGVAATLHFVASSPSSDYIEINAVPLEADFIKPALRPTNGFLSITQKPGLGIEIDREVVERYRYKGS